MKNETKYIKEARVSQRLYGNYRKRENKKFKALINELNSLVEQILTNKDENEEQERLAKKLNINT